MLEVERTSHHTVQLSLRAKTLELQEAKASADDEARRLRRAVGEAEEAADRHKQRLREAEAAHAEARVGTEATGEVARRLEGMGAQLLKKQIALDDATCARAALTARLRAAVQRAAKLEEQVRPMSVASAAKLPPSGWVAHGGILKSTTLQQVAALQTTAQSGPSLLGHQVCQRNGGGHLSPLM